MNGLPKNDKKRDILFGSEYIELSRSEINTAIYMVFSRFHSCVAVLGKKIDFLVCVNAIDVFDILGKCYVEKVGLIPRVICYHDIMFAFIHVAAVEESDKSRWASRNFR